MLKILGVYIFYSFGMLLTCVFGVETMSELFNNFSCFFESGWSLYVLLVKARRSY